MKGLKGKKKMKELPSGSSKSENRGEELKENSRMESPGHSYLLLLNLCPETPLFLIHPQSSIYFLSHIFGEITMVKCKCNSLLLL